MPVEPRDPGPQPTSDGAPGTDDLIYRYLERVEAGESGTRVLAELQAEQPACADALARGVGLLRRTSLHPAVGRDRLPERIGRFRIERKLGEGGMGVVYAARQESPQRRVALKLIRPDQLHFEGARERFGREIASVARLSHPGIAAVLEVGEDDGLPWFTQELVAGVPLSELLAALPAHALESIRAEDARAVVERALADVGERVEPGAWNAEFFRGSWVELVLRIGRRVAEALQHAHERGVLHRDVKPSNVLVTPDGRAVLVDFGLASLEGTGRLTRTGAQLGSVHYMSPEQLEGRIEDVDARSDVYALGITLYELLTLRAPYTSRSLERLRGLILRGEAPQSRRLNRAVPRDASTVCAKAMEPARERRYASAAALAADLAAVLEHKTIAARPAGPLMRTTRWCQRHPARAVAALAAFLVFVVAPLAFARERSRAARDLARVNVELESALAVSQQNLESATQAIERVMRWTAEEGLDDVPGMLELRARVIDEALAVFADLRARRADDPELALQAGTLLRTRGAILKDLRRTEEALESFREAEAILETRALTPDADPRWIEELALAWHSHGRALENVARLEAAVPCYRSALHHLRRAREHAPDDPGLLRDLGLACASLANVLQQTEGATQESASLVDEAVAAGTRLVALAPTSIDARTGLYVSLLTRGRRSQTAADFVAAERDFAECVRVLEPALELAPGDRDVRWNLAEGLQHLGWVMKQRGEDLAGAGAALERGLALATELARENPREDEYEQSRLGMLGQLAELERRRGDAQAAYAMMLELARAWRTRAEADPHSADVWINAAILEFDLANVALNDEARGPERAALVLEHCDRAEALLERGNADAAARRFVAELRLFLQVQRGGAAFVREDPEGVVAALEALEGLALDGPMPAFQAACLWEKLGGLTGEPEAYVQALERFEQAVEAGFADPGLIEEMELVQGLVACGHVDAARVEELERRVVDRAGAR